jgi:hypothetical protein
MRSFLSILVFLGLCSQAAFASNFTQKFISPGKSCQLTYEGAESNGDGVFYDTTGGKKKVVHKGYLRIGPIVNWMSNSIAELQISEGSPSYHSYYYDCREQRISPSYSLPIAFDAQNKIIATLEQEEIVFYRLFSEKEFFRAKAAGIGLTEYFESCEPDSKFENANMFHIKMKCEDGSNIDLKIKVPN